MTLIDNPNAPQKELTKAELQDFVDEQTVFSLAVIMMEIHTATLLKNKNGVANNFMKVGVILRNNPGFPKRFKAIQQQILDQMKNAKAPTIEIKT